MHSIIFEWDVEKNLSNIKKHGISFEEARTAFEDPNILYKTDPDHSEQEDRFIIFGFSEEARVLAVCHCYIQSDTVIRIISARKATKNENISYWRGIL